MTADGPGGSRTGNDEELVLGPSHDAAASPSPSTRAGLTLHGHLVTLRSPRMDDVRFLAAAARQPFADLMVHSDLFRTYEDDPESFHARLMEDDAQLVLVVYRRGVETSRPLGYVRLFSMDPREHYAFLEVMLVDRHAMRKGLGVEAGRMICCYGMDTFGLERIEAKVYAYNRLSANTLLRNGFELEGVLRHARFVRGAWHDVLVFAILRDELHAGRQLLPEGRTGSIRWPSGPRRLPRALNGHDHEVLS
jgi:RimJ/RimL family protein N-acetyltransferase